MIKYRERGYDCKLIQYLVKVPTEVVGEFSRKIEDIVDKRKQYRPYFRDQLMMNNDFCF